MHGAKVRFLCPSSYKKSFPNSHCLLAISVGQASQEGDRLLGTLEKISANFKTCTILIADTLQRHNYEETHDQEKAYQAAKKHGDIWLHTHQKYLDIINFPFKIIRWDQILNHPDYPTYLQKIDDLYATSDMFKDAVDQTAFNYACKHKRPINKKYILEECAQLLLMKNNIFNFLIYPSVLLPPMLYIHEHFIASNSKHILDPVALEIKSRHCQIKKEPTIINIHNTPQLERH